MKNIKFSIIMLVYNTKEEYLRYAISSVLNQEYDNFELIIVDDGSNKETKDILKDYEKNCIIHHQDNMGMSASRLEGLKLVHGDYVMFVDSDDYINPKTCSIYNDIIQKYGSDIVMQDFVKFTGGIDNILSQNDFFKEGIVEKQEVLRQLCLLHTNGTCGRAVKKQLFEGMAQSIDTSFTAVGEDVQQSTYVLLKANSFYYTKERIYYYRIVLEHRAYYDIKKVNDINFLTPVYKMLFSDNSHKELLSIFKTSVVNNVIFNAFRVCLWIKDRKQKYSLLDQIKKLEIISIINSIDEKISFVSSFLYFVFNKRLYFALNVLAKIYDLVYGMQKL